MAEKTKKTRSRKKADYQKTQKYDRVSVIRFIYLYIITAVTFIVFIIGAVSIVNVVLKEFVFEIDEDYYARPYFVCESYMFSREDGTPAIEEYEKCMEQQKKLAVERSKGPVSESGARALSIGIAQVLVAFPLWIFHWRIIERDRKERKSGRTIR